MKDNIRTIARQIVFPLYVPDMLENDKGWWRVLCVLLTIPFTAVFHHAVFYRPTCMLNPFGYTYYNELSGLVRWLSRDPSLPWAIVAAVFIYNAGRRYTLLKLCIAPVFIAFLPISIWIWDIPFTNRIICTHFHDGNLTVLGHPVRSMYLYLLGILIYLIFLANILYTRNKSL